MPTYNTTTNELDILERSANIFFFNKQCAKWIFKISADFSLEHDFRMLLM